MILVPEATRKQIAEIVRAIDSSAVSQIEGARQMHAVDPEHFLPYLFLGQEQAAAGNLDAAESLYWQGLERGPCSYTFYMSLGGVRGVRDPQDPLAVALKVLAFSKMAVAGEVDDEIAGQLRGDLEGLPFDFKNPEDLELFASVLEARTKNQSEPPEVAGRLRPYWIFHDLQRQAPDDVSHDVLERLRENADACVPILRAALGEWSRLQHNLSAEALRFVVALLGELGSADLLDDLLELSMLDDDALFLHAQWAIRRIGQRFPSETFCEVARGHPHGASVDALRHCGTPRTAAGIGGRPGGSPGVAAGLFRLH
ncbi:MAG TPA: hypothetical protein VE959_29515 [Bryobacteraceae bacterium]|nr:hypothetical protein [Bryobacteraceae bacterium]